MLALPFINQSYQRLFITVIHLDITLINFRKDIKTHCFENLIHLVVVCVLQVDLEKTCAVIFRDGFPFFESYLPVTRVASQVAYNHQNNILIGIHFDECQYFRKLIIGLPIVTRVDQNEPGRALCLHRP